MNKLICLLLLTATCHAQHRLLVSGCNYGKFVAERLANGNTLIACGDAHRILEIDAKGSKVWKLEQNDLPGISIGFVAGLQRLPNGNTLFSNWGGHGGTSGASVIEVSPDKKLVWSTSPGKANRISNIKVLK